MSTNLVTLQEIKRALQDSGFRSTLPDVLKNDIIKFLNNPGCSCNVPIYRNVMIHAREQLQNYYPHKIVLPPDEEKEALSKNNWTIINCSIHELEFKLSKLSPGRKQISMARYEDQVTVIVNEIDIIY